jgi:hypothetical protein
MVYNSGRNAIFTAQFLESAFKNSGNATLENINMQAVVDAAAQAFPTWLPYLLDAKFALATLGSLLVIILLNSCRSDTALG